MIALSITLFLFGLAFLIHIIIWRIKLPRRQTNTFLRIFFYVFLFGIIIFGNYLFERYSLHVVFLKIVQICLLYGSIVIAYMVSYPAAYADSPTLVILLKITEAKSQGLRKEALEEILTNEFLINPRIKDLLDDKLIYLADDKYRLTEKGRNFIKLFITYRKFLNIPLKG